MSDLKSAPVRPALDAGKMDYEDTIEVQCSSSGATGDSDVSTFENLPGEIILKIATQAENDSDIRALILTCRTMNRIIDQNSSPVWRNRFLVQYDYPQIDHIRDFDVAYKLRNLVLRRFAKCGNSRDQRVDKQIQVLKDIILESFNGRRPNTIVVWSRNIAQFRLSYKSPWLIQFLSAPFYDHDNDKYGKPNELFDAMQLCFSYLLFLPQLSPAHLFIPAQRNNYDISIVYRWNQPFETFYHRTPRINGLDLSDLTQEDLGFLASLSGDIPKLFELDLNKLLHVRNFWHRHLSDNLNSGYLHHTSSIDEHTYGSMARGLANMGYSPKPWDRLLRDVDNDLASKQLSLKWYGHYSCLYPWPRTKMDLEEIQSSADEWDEVDPLTLDFYTSTDNVADCCWPPVFNTIPAFAQTVPSINRHCTFLRGIAPFLNLSTSKSKTRDPLKYHPYLALRLRGVIHKIEAQAGIPGWQRVVMVLYKPNTRYLIQVLEYAEQEFGDPHATSLTAALAANTTNADAAANAGGQATIDMSEVERITLIYLKRKISVRPDLYAKELMTKHRIAKLEDTFSEAQYLDWADIEYAYAYEGILTPGGKVMLGRWWRCGIMGDNDGREVGDDGLPLDMEDEEDDDVEKRAERGPFVFWC